MTARFVDEGPRSDGGAPRNGVAADRVSVRNLLRFPRGTVGTSG